MCRRLEEQRPEEPIAEELAWYWKAYEHLRSEAPLGALGGLGDVPWLKVEEYLDRRGVRSAWMRDFTHAVIEHLHATYQRELNQGLKAQKN